MDTKELVSTMTDRQKEVIHTVNRQMNDGVLRIVCGCTKSVTEPSKQQLRAVLSSETVDRYGDVILADSFNTKKNFLNYFDSNAILLWAHGRDSSVPNLPIGSVKNPSFNGTDINGKRAFEGDVIFADTHQHAIDVWRLYEKEYLRAFSVGFRPITTSKDPVSEGQTGLTFKEVDLLENSAVPIPANPAAMRKAFIDGIVSEEFLHNTFFKMRDEILVRNADIFVPTSWKYKDSINELAILAEEVKSGKVNVTKSVVTKNKTEYECPNCQAKSMVVMEDFPEKTYQDETYRDVTCEACDATTEHCLEAIEFLLSIKS